MKSAAIRNLALCAAMALSLPAQAGAGVTTPEEFSGVPNLRPMDDVAGLEAFVSNVSEMVWLRDPRTGFRIAGFVFDESGKSVNPAHTQAAALTLDSFITANFPPDTVRIPEPLVPDVEQRLGKLGEADREAAIRALITTLRDVDGEEAFNLAVSDWLAAVDRQIAEAPAATPAASEAPVPASAASAADPMPAAPVPGKAETEAAQ